MVKAGLSVGMAKSPVMSVQKSEWLARVGRKVQGLEGAPGSGGGLLALPSQAPLAAAVLRDGVADFAAVAPRIEDECCPASEPHLRPVRIFRVNRDSPALQDRRNDFSVEAAIRCHAPCWSDTWHIKRRA